MITKKRLKEILRHKTEIISWQTELIKQLKDDCKIANDELRRVKADLAYAEYKLRETQEATQYIGG